HCRPGGPGTGLPALPPNLAGAVGELRADLQYDLQRPANHIYWIEGETVSGPTDRAAAIDYAPVQVEAAYVSASRMRAKESYDDAERMARDTLSRAESMGHRILVAKTRLMLAEIAAVVGRDLRSVRAALDEAVRAIEHLPGEDPVLVARLKRDLGVIAIVSGHRELFADAVVHLEGSLTGLPKDSDDEAEAMMELADALQRLGRTQEARPYWDAIVQRRRRIAAAATDPAKKLRHAAQLAEVLAISGDHREAIRELRQALSDAPPDLESWLQHVSLTYIGDWSLHLGDAESAIEAFERSRSIHKPVEGEPTGVRGIEQGLAGADVLRGKLSEAEVRLVALVARGDAPWLHERIAWLRLALGRQDLGRESAALAFADAQRRFDEQEDGLHDARLVQAAALLATGDAAEAASLLDHDHVLDGDNTGVARKLLSLALVRQGRDATRAEELMHASELARAKPDSEPHIDAEVVWRDLMFVAIDRIAADG
ncbi:MAG: hypothetical protein AAF721_36840, partial [Myxococcota bacterium]